MLQGIVRVSDIMDWLDEWAPFSSAEEWDNVGLLAGSADCPVSKIVTALDISPDVVRQAAKAGAELIISHHPVIYSPIKRLEQDNPVYQIARHGISAVAVHTNMDKAAGGVNDILAKTLGLINVRVLEDGFVRVGSLEKKLKPEEFTRFVGKRLGVPVGGVVWAKGGRQISTVAVSGGSGGDFIGGLPCDVDAFVTGELKYHEWPFEPVVTIVAAGHFYTETLISREIAQRLSVAFPDLTVIPAKERCRYDFV